MRAWTAGAALSVRNPAAVRPWQHVLEPLIGYLLLAERVSAGGASFDAWNFGPSEQEERPVSWICDRLAGLWGPGAAWEVAADAHPYEAKLLAIDSAKARRELNWTSRLGAGRRPSPHYGLVSLPP